MSHRVGIAAWVIAAFPLLCPAWPTAAAAPPARGISILAPDIGNDLAVEDLIDFVQQGRFSPVVIDWAWITAHWERTNFTQVNRLIDLLSARGVEVAAMYRPRFLDRATVPIQVDRAGRPAASHGQYICFASDEARRWGIAWGERILERCPKFGEIIIYNPLNQCQCASCLAARGSDPYGHYAQVWQFLAEARAAWRKHRPGVKLGVVFVADPEFWSRGAQVADVARPFLFITDDTDMEKDMAAATAVREMLGDKVRACLAKITWGEGDKVAPDRLAAFDALARQTGNPYFFWTFDTLFLSNLYDLRAVSQALGLDFAALAASVLRMRAARTPNTGPQGDASYPDRQIATTPAETFFQAMAAPQPGYHMYAGLWALERKAKMGDAAATTVIVNRAIQLIGELSRPFQQRLQCCLLLGSIGGEPVVPTLARILAQDPAAGVRMAAAGALGQINSPQAKEALQGALRRERNRQVRKAIADALGADLGKLAGTAQASSLRKEEETYLADASRCPSSPVRVQPSRLPWPFPGGVREQNIYNNYQQPTDIYIHGGLDFLQPAGTPVRAVDAGYVAAIYTNYPEWKTHHSFIITPKRGGDEGWCYVHVDPDTYTFKPGDYVTQGQVLGSLVKFSVGDKPGVDHLHLHYVRFHQGPEGKVEVVSLLDPIYFFDCADTEVPHILTPFHFVRDGTLEEFAANGAGEVAVSGAVDIIVGIGDGAYPGHGCNWGVPVVTFAITGPVPYALQKLVLDHRGEISEKGQTRPLYLSNEERERVARGTVAYPRPQFLRITKTDGDGAIEPADALQNWDTAARDASGKRIWPDGLYTVTVFAWDLAGNRAVEKCSVRVNNG